MRPLFCWILWNTCLSVSEMSHQEWFKQQTLKQLFSFLALQHYLPSYRLQSCVISPESLRGATMRNCAVNIISIHHTAFLFRSVALRDLHMCFTQCWRHCESCMVTVAWLISTGIPDCALIRAGCELKLLNHHGAQSCCYCPCEGCIAMGPEWQGGRVPGGSTQTCNFSFNFFVA